MLRTLPGLRRPALVAAWPTRNVVLAVLDLGADFHADAEQLVEFAIMGAAYFKAVHHNPDPKIGLLNIGSEELKGRESVREEAQLTSCIDRKRQLTTRTRWVGVAITNGSCLARLDAGDLGLLRSTTSNGRF